MKKLIEFLNSDHNFNRWYKYLSDTTEQLKETRLIETDLEVCTSMRVDYPRLMMYRDRFQRLFNCLFDPDAACTVADVDKIRREILEVESDIQKNLVKIISKYTRDETDITVLLHELTSKTTEALTEDERNSLLKASFLRACSLCAKLLLQRLEIVADGISYEGASRVAYQEFVTRYRQFCQDNLALLRANTKGLLEKQRRHSRGCEAPAAESSHPDEGDSSWDDEPEEVSEVGLRSRAAAFFQPPGDSPGLGGVTYPQGSGCNFG